MYIKAFLTIFWPNQSVLIQKVAAQASRGYNQVDKIEFTTPQEKCQP